MSPPIGPRFFMFCQETHKAFFGAEMPQLSKKNLTANLSAGSPNLSAIQKVWIEAIMGIYYPVIWKILGLFSSPISREIGK